jgi:hypothetical protein
VVWCPAANAALPPCALVAWLLVQCLRGPRCPASRPMALSAPCPRTMLSPRCRRRRPVWQCLPPFGRRGLRCCCRSAVLRAVAVGAPLVAPSPSVRLVPVVSCVHALLPAGAAVVVVAVACSAPGGSAACPPLPPLLLLLFSPAPPHASSLAPLARLSVRPWPSLRLALPPPAPRGKRCSSSEPLICRAASSRAGDLLPRSHASGAHSGA